MKIAIITITDDAQVLAFRLAVRLEDDPTVITVSIFHKNVKNALEIAFKEYDCIICIMAAGIVVRNICGLIKNKIEDPAVIVMDDAGKHVISLLYGHFGGANNMIGAQPVKTTATDLHGKIGIDTIAGKYFLYIDDPGRIKGINNALLEDKNPDLYIPERFNFIFDDPLIRSSYNEYKSVDDHLKAVFEDNEIILKPKKLVVGIGARKGVSQTMVQKAIESMINQLDLSIERIDAISTAEIKRHESGIIETALKLNLSLEIVSMDKIENFNDPQCSKSDFVKNKFGVYGISEPSALIAAGKGSKLIFRKTAFNGVTVALAASSN